VQFQHRYLSVEQAAEFLQVSPKSLRNRTGPKAQDPLPPGVIKRVGRLLRLDRVAIEKHLETHNRL
jgi:hypothetical protein